jgi:flagellar hook-associated protein 1 FlgK
VTATQDIDLSTISTVQDLANALSAVPGLTAQVDSQGHLSLNTATGQGVALADMGVQVSGGGTSVSGYFGLDDVFTGASASDIALNTAIASDPNRLPTATLSTASGLAPGQIGVASGDTTNADALGQALSASQSFSAAGGFPAQTTSLTSYAASFVSSAAQLVSDSDSKASTSTATFNAAQGRLQNTTNVNSDEELANLSSLEQQYQANAQMIATVRTLFSALMTMMSTT